MDARLPANQKKLAAATGNMAKVRRMTASAPSMYALAARKTAPGIRNGAASEIEKANMRP